MKRWLWTERCGWGLWVLAIAGLGWLLHAEATAAGRATGRLGRARQERTRLCRVEPVPTETSARDIAVDIAAAESALAELKERFGGLGSSPDVEPSAEPVETYLAVKSFNDRMAESAARMKIAFDPASGFGLAEDERRNPQAMARVRKVATRLEPLLIILFEARPAALVAVKSGDAAGLAPSLSARSTGIVNTEAFRFEFLGDTTALREFLNGLAASPLPAIVAEVSVESMEGAAGNRALQPARDGRPPGCKFAVIVEWLEWVDSDTDRKPI